MSAQQNPVQLIASSASTSISLSSSAKPVVTKSFTGHFRNLRIKLAGILALIFFGTPWLSWGGRQAVLWDLDTQKFYIFGSTFLPQDFIALAAILMLAAVGLLASNVLVGRAWCGYTCPQSTWTWAFMWVEKITEGDRNQRIKLNQSQWSLSKIIRCTLKHGAWLAISLATGIAFIGYFVPIKQLWIAILQLDWLNETGFWVFSFTAATYINAGWLREQVCLHMCPYSRFQSVIFDKDTLVVTYDAARGENRGSRKKELDHKAAGLGDCIDCVQCVQVCPTGIDIRNGLQMDCIGCGACIDACDSIMEKMDYPKGLIRYTSEREQEGGNRRFFRPLVFAYGAALVAAVLLLAISLQSREPVSLSVAKDRHMFKIDGRGKVVNIFILKVTNKTQAAQHYEISLDENQTLELPKSYQLMAAPGEILTLPVSVAMVERPENASGTLPFYFVVTDSNHRSSFTRTKAIFTFPGFHK